MSGIDDFMSGIDDFLHRFPDYPVMQRQLDYARFLEQQGLVFLVEFGFENAEEIAWAFTDPIPQ
jgi:hypothetical protein